MATIRFTAKVEENGSITIPSEKIKELGAKPGDEIDISLQPYAPHDAFYNFEGDLLREFIDVIRGSGVNLSDNSGEKLSDAMKRKRRKDLL